jgi:hypothetical protein
MHILGDLLLAAMLAVGWMLTLLGMPGNWLMVASAALYATLFTPGAHGRMGWGLVLALAIMAALGDTIEWVAGALGVARRGGSRRGALLALLGSMVGGVVGLFVGLPIPLVGPIVAALLCAGLGALVGAVLGETWKGSGLRRTWQIGKAAFWGRLAGSLAKILIASVMVAVALVAMLW